LIESIVSSLKAMERLRAGVTWPYLQGFAEDGGPSRLLSHDGYTNLTTNIE